MKAKRTLSLCLLAAMLTSTACGESSATAEDTSASSSQDDTTTAAPIDEYTVSDVDYGGKTVTFAGYDYDGTWRILDYSLAVMEENGDVINDAIVKRNRQVEEELNVNIELLPMDSSDRGSSKTIQKYILAQEDTITVGTQMAAGLSQLLTTEGMLIDLNNIPTLDLSHSWWNQNANEEYTIYGKQLAAVGDINLFNLGAPVVVFFSKILAEENKIGNLYQMVYDGKWTLDTMAKLAADTARDINGNAEVDAEDIFGFAGESDSTFYTTYGSGIRFSERDNAGEIRLTLNSERTVDVVQRFTDLLRNQRTSIFNVEWNVHYTSSISDFMMPKLMKNELLFFSNQLHVALNLRDMESDFGIIPMPKYDEAQENYVTFGNGHFSDHIVVPATNNDLEMTGHLLEAMGYYAQQYITPAFIDTSVKNKSTRDEDSINMINLILETQIFDVGFIFNWGGMKGVLTTIANQNTPDSFAADWAAKESAIRTEFEKTVSMLKGE